MQNCGCFLAGDIRFSLVICVLRNVHCNGHFPLSRTMIWFMNDDEMAPNKPILLHPNLGPIVCTLSTFGDKVFVGFKSKEWWFKVLWGLGRFGRWLLLNDMITICIITLHTAFRVDALGNACVFSLRGWLLAMCMWVVSFGWVAICFLLPEHVQTIPVSLHLSQKKIPLFQSHTLKKAKVPLYTNSLPVRKYRLTCVTLYGLLEYSWDYPESLNPL